MYFQAFERLRATDAPILVAEAADRQALRAALDRAGRGGALSAWLATPVLTWQQALADAHAAALIAGRLPEGTDLLLSGAQELAVWSATVAADGELELAAPLQVAPLARQAWRLRHLWGVAVAAGLQASVDQRAYLRWETAYRRTLATLGAVDAATVLTTSVRHLACGTARPQGFVRPPPALAAWLGPANGDGPAAEVGCYVAHAYPDRAQELATALTWGHAIAAAEPLARVVVACADVASEQAMLERVVRDVCGDTAACFIGAGASLRRDPLFVGASSILAVAPVMRWDALSALVRAPCLAGAAAEGAARATLDERLRATERHELPLALVIDQVAADGGCPLLAAGLRRLLDLWRAAPRQARMAAWLEHFDQLLAAVGWPGLPPGHPHAEAARRAWNALCDRLCGLDAVLPPVGRGAALARLEHALDDTPRATTTPRLGLYVVNYATALALDPTHVWLSGLDSHAVVGGARPSPLLPLAAQRAVGVPGAEPGRDLWHARRLLAALAARGVEHHASYAAGDGEQRLAPSPLVPALAGAAIVAPATQVPVRWRQAPAVLETTSDLAGTPLPAGSRVDGGVAVLAAQSACAFRAYARHRLYATAPLEPRPGLGRRAQGTAVHRALAAIWREVGDTTRLAALDTPSRAALVARAARDAIRPPPAPTALEHELVVIERDRLVVLLEAWLAAECARPPCTVLACEAAHETEWQGLSFGLRLDRVERRADGSVVVVDYKTGACAASEWDVPRMTAPQLPFYALTAPYAGIAGIAYARVVAGAAAWIEYPRPGKDDDFATRAQAWRQDVDALVAALHAGHAQPAPKHPGPTCRGCEQQLFCRLAELAWVDAVDDTDPDGGGVPDETATGDADDAR